MGLGHNLRGEVQELAEVGETLVGEGVVVPLPRELGLDVALGGEGLHGLDDLEVADLGQVGVRGTVKVLGGDKDTLLEEGLVDLDNVSFGFCTRDMMSGPRHRNTHRDLTATAKVEAGRNAVLTVRRFCLVMIIL